MGTIEIRTELPGPRSREIIARKERVVCDPLDLHAPVVIDRGSGASFTDVDGNRMLDFSGGLGCQIVGYSHPKVVEAVRRQAERVSHTDFSVIPYESYVELAERIVERTGGGDRRAAFFNSGAEAVENAVKFAKAATGRSGVLVFDGAFHGRTLLTMTMTSRFRPYKKGFGPFAPEVYRLPYPYPYRSEFGEDAGRRALEEIRRMLRTQIDPESVAICVVEPQQGEGGFVVPTQEFLPGLAELCREHGIVFAVDEIQTGYGRTGRFLASEHFGVEPDLVILAKAIASGYPLSAVVGRAEVMNAPGFSAIGGTYVGNPVACTAGIAVLEVIEEEGLVERAEQIGKTLRARWEQIGQQVPEVGDIRGLGAMVGVEMVTDRDSKQPAGELVSRLMAETARRGVVTVACGPYHNVLRHLIPLVITDAELDEGLDVLAESAVAAAQGGREAGVPAPSAATEPD